MGQQEVSSLVKPTGAKADAIMTFARGNGHTGLAAMGVSTEESEHELEQQMRVILKVHSVKVNGILSEVEIHPEFRNSVVMGKKQCF